MPELINTQEQAETWFGIYQSKDPPSALSMRFNSVMHNMTLVRGMPHLRPGVRRITGVQLGSGSNRTMYAMDVWKGSPDLLISICGSSIQSIPNVGGDPTTLTDATPAGYGAFVGVAPTNTVHLKNLLFIVNSSSPNRKFNGTNITRMGLVAPSSLGAPSKSGGAIVGTRNYRATLVSSALNGSAESEPTTVTSVSYSSQQGTFSSPTVPSSDPQVDRWNLYGEVSGHYYRVNASPATLATSIVDNLDDATLAVAVEMDAIGTNAVPPGNFKLLAVHQGRLVATIGTNTLYWSDLGLDLGGLYAKPHAWPAANQLTFPETGGQSITGFISFYEWIVIFQESGIWSVRHSLADEDVRVIAPVMVAPDYRGIGVPNQGCINMLDNQILFAAKDQPYAIRRDLSGLTPNLTVSPRGEHIHQLWQAVDFTAGAVSCADRDNRRWIFIGQGASL